MKSCAYAPSSTYGQYQIRKNAVIGKTKRRNLLRSAWNSGLACISTNCSDVLIGVSRGG